MPAGCPVHSVAGRAVCAILWPLFSEFEAIVQVSCVCHRRPRLRSVPLLAPVLAAGSRPVCKLVLGRYLCRAQPASVICSQIPGGPRLGRPLSRDVALRFLDVCRISLLNTVFDEFLAFACSQIAPQGAQLFRLRG